jgi:hypothetical protein
VQRSAFLPADLLSSSGDQLETSTTQAELSPGYGVYFKRLSSPKGGVGACQGRKAHPKHITLPPPP